jgi:hypothetical protein
MLHSMTKRPRGRPKKDETLPNPITIRLPSGIADFIDQVVEDRRDKDGADKTQVIREMLAAAMELSRKRK